MYKLPVFIWFIFILANSFTTVAQSPLSDNTLKLDDPSNMPNASLQSLAWLQGHWQGESMGGISEEIWSLPAAGSMMGVYRFIKDGNVSFYEIVTITEEKSSLMLRLKHFNADLTGWEEKEETVDFPLVKMEENTAFFDGFTIRKVNFNEMIIYVMIGTENDLREEAFRYRRAEKEN